MVTLFLILVAIISGGISFGLLFRLKIVESAVDDIHSSLVTACRDIADIHTDSQLAIHLATDARELGLDASARVGAIEKSTHKVEYVPTEMYGKLRDTLQKAAHDPLAAQQVLNDEAQKLDNMLSGFTDGLL